MGRGNSEAEGHSPTCSDVNCEKIAEPIEMLFGLWTQVGSRKYVLDGA